MRGGRFGWLLPCAVAAACSFEAAGQGDANEMIGDSTTSGTSTTNETTTTQTPVESDAGTSGTVDGADSTSGSPPQESESSGPPSTAPALLEFDGDDPLDLGTLPLGGADPLVLVVRNTGYGAADITGGEVASPLIWAGGEEFPGVGGTCEGLLPPGATCELAVAVGAGQPGFSSQLVAVDYDDGQAPQRARKRVDLLAEGMGPNLLVNPSGESDAPGPTITGWDQVQGDFQIEGGCAHGSGSVCFFAGESSMSSLVQDIDVSSFDDAFNAAPLGLSFEAWSQSDGFINDPHDIDVRFFDDVDNVLGGQDRTDMDHSSWEATRFELAIPPATRRIRVTLVCDRSIGSNCSAWFDDMRANFTYPPP